MVLLDLGKVLVLRPTSSQSVAPVKRRIPLGISYKENIHYWLTLISQDFSLHLWLRIIKLHGDRNGKPFMQIFTGNSACNNHHLTLFKSSRTNERDKKYLLIWAFWYRWHHCYHFLHRLVVCSQTYFVIFGRQLKWKVLIDVDFSDSRKKDAALSFAFLSRVSAAAISKRPPVKTERENIETNTIQ